MAEFENGYLIMGDIDIVNLVSHLLIYMVVLLLAISATRPDTRGCRTNMATIRHYMLGRVTLNPVAHTDPIGTLLIPIVCVCLGRLAALLASIPLIGWGKPTPVNPRKWTKYKQANVMVSIAGIGGESDPRDDWICYFKTLLEIPHLAEQSNFDSGIMSR